MDQDEWGIEEAWRELRRRVADRLDELADGDSLALRPVSEDPVPFVRALADGDLLRLQRPAGPVRLGRGEVERAAFLVVEALQEVVLHPSFLTVEGRLDLSGLRTDGEPDRRGRTPLGPDPSYAVVPTGHEHLVRLVMWTVEEFLGQPPDEDEDGDLPVMLGERSMVFVGVAEGRPIVTLTSLLVVDIPDLVAAREEVDEVARRLPYLSVRLIEDQVVVRHELCAVPFAPKQLQLWLGRLAGDLDEVAQEVAGRLGAKCFLDDYRAWIAEQEAGPLQPTLPLTDLERDVFTLTELHYLSHVTEDQVLSVFKDDRQRLVQALVGIRTGRIHVEGRVREHVLDALRRGLWRLVDSQTRPDGTRGPIPARRAVSRQLSLLDDEQPPLDGLEEDEAH